MNENHYDEVSSSDLPSTLISDIDVAFYATNDDEETESAFLNMENDVGSSNNDNGEDPDGNDAGTATTTSMNFDLLYDLLLQRHHEEMDEVKDCDATMQTDLANFHQYEIDEFIGFTNRTKARVAKHDSMQVELCRKEKQANAFALDWLYMVDNDTLMFTNLLDNELNWNNPFFRRIFYPKNKKQSKSYDRFKIMKVKETFLNNLYLGMDAGNKLDQREYPIYKACSREQIDEYQMLDQIDKEDFDQIFGNLDVVDDDGSKLRSSYKKRKKLLKKVEKSRLKREKTSYKKTKKRWSKHQKCYDEFYQSHQHYMDTRTRCMKVFDKLLNLSRDIESFQQELEDW